MGIARLAPEEVAAASVEALGLDKEIADLRTPEVLAAAIRRAASFHCPTSPRSLARIVEESLIGVVDWEDTDGERPVRAMLQDLVGYGDLVEVPVEDPGRGTLHRTLFLGQPAYVRVSETMCLLVGVPADGLALVDDDLADRVDHDAHVRRIQLAQGEEPDEILGGAGLLELEEEHWLERPPTCAAEDLLAEYDARLLGAGPSGTVADCRILDPSQAVTYYRGRWRSPRKIDTGRFVARRPLQFGSDAWCYAELCDGEVEKLIDLPVHHHLHRSCDEAWRLQAAIDAVRGSPQRVRIERPPSAAKVVLRFLSPIPSWAQRRLDAVARPLGRQLGSLISYRVEEQQLEAELSFLADTMWIEVEQGVSTA